MKITGFYYSPEGPVEGGNVTFAVKVYNSIGNGITAMLKLVVEDKNSGEVVYSEEKSISPEYLDDSEYTFTWSNVKAGEYTAEAKGIYNEKVKDTASISSINILARASSVVGGFDILPTEVYLGDTVTFHYIIRPIEGTELENPTVSLKIEDEDSFFSKTYYGATVTWDNYIEDYTEHKFNGTGKYTVLLLVDGAVVYSRTIEVKPLQGMVVKLDCPEEPVLLGTVASCDVILENNPLEFQASLKVSGLWFDESATAGAVIGVNSPSGRAFAPHETGVITTLSLDLDKIAHALGLDDPRDLNPYTERWDCHDGSCVYLRERFDRQHYITVEVQAVNDAKDYLKTIQITRTITTRYSGSKYWKTDAGVGIATGVGALAATVALPTYLGVESTASTTPWIIVQIEEKARTLSTMSLAEPAKDVLRKILNILWRGHDE